MRLPSGVDVLFLSLLEPSFPAQTDRTRVVGGNQISE